MRGISDMATLMMDIILQTNIVVGLLCIALMTSTIALIIVLSKTLYANRRAYYGEAGKDEEESEHGK